RRCERAGTRFALVLIHLDELSQALPHERCEHLVGTFGAFMRETDIIGWYRQGSAIGLILTTLADTTREALEPVIVGRVRKVLSCSLEQDQVQSIGISCHIFPDEDLDGSSTGKSHRMFYPDDQKQNLKNKSSRFLKRAVDVSGSLAALVV